MKYKAIFAVALMLAMAFACVIPAEDDDAANKIEISLKDGSSYSINKGRPLTVTLVYFNDVQNYPSTVEVYLSSDSSTPIYQRLFLSYY